MSVRLLPRFPRSKLTVFLIGKRRHMGRSTRALCAGRCPEARTIISVQGRVETKL